MGYDEMLAGYQNKPDQLLTRKEAAKILRVEPETLATWACLKRYNLPYVKIGSRAMYRKHEVEDFITERQHD